MKYPIDEAKIAAIVVEIVPADYEGNREVVVDILRSFIPLINRAYADGKREALKEVKKGSVQA